MNPLFNYLLKLADDTLIFGQRLGELTGQEFVSRRRYCTDEYRAGLSWPIEQFL
ncbi:phenylacetate-CoA oxygenase subunit PaaI [Kaistella anthropi]|nr:phenylacetate-CoA oxygenase subunit PaaI [Kaistella anthropi]